MCQGLYMNFLGATSAAMTRHEDLKRVLTSLHESKRFPGIVRSSCCEACAESRAQDWLRCYKQMCPLLKPKPTYGQVR